MNTLREVKKTGGVRTIPDRRYFFPTMGEVSQKIILRTFETEDIEVYNVNFPAGMWVEMTGEIADKLIFDFPEHFEVLAVNGNTVVTPNEIQEYKGKKQFKLAMANGNLVPFNKKVNKPLEFENKPKK